MFKFTLSEDLIEILGFPNRELERRPTKNVRAPDVFRSMMALYAYLTLVEPRLVRDMRELLFRTVPITGEPLWPFQHLSMYLSVILVHVWCKSPSLATTEK